MKNCPNCHNQAKDDARFCPVCGTTLDAVPQPDPDYFRPATQPVTVAIPVMRVPDRHDHTDDYSVEDIQESKIPCMCVYLLDFLGVIIALLMCPTSKYARFHIRQSLRLTILEVLIVLASALLCWTFLVPIAGAIGLLVLFVLRLICFVDVCKGNAKDAPIIRNIKFLN